MLSRISFIRQFNREVATLHTLSDQKETTTFLTLKIEPIAKMLDSAEEFNETVFSVFFDAEKRFGSVHQKAATNAFLAIIDILYKFKEFLKNPHIDQDVSPLSSTSSKERSLSEDRSPIHSLVTDDDLASPFGSINQDSPSPSPRSVNKTPSPSTPETPVTLATAKNNRPPRYLFFSPRHIVIYSDKVRKLTEEQGQLVRQPPRSPRS